MPLEGFDPNKSDEENTRDNEAFLAAHPSMSDNALDKLHKALGEAPLPAGDVMTPDGRREVAMGLLNEWRAAANKVDAPYIYQSVRDLAVKEEERLRETILELMGVDS